MLEFIIVQIKDKNEKIDEIHQRVVTTQIRPKPTIGPPIRFY